MCNNAMIAIYLEKFLIKLKKILQFYTMVAYVCFYLHNKYCIE